MPGFLCCPLLPVPESGGLLVQYRRVQTCISDYRCIKYFLTFYFHVCRFEVFNPAQREHTKKRKKGKRLCGSRERTPVD